MDGIVILGWDAGEFFSPERMTSLVRVAVLIFVGTPLVYLISKWSRIYITSKISAHRGMIAGKVILYLGLAILIISTLNELGFELAPLLGAAGIIGIAVGFASQTSVSNVISGVFLIAEQPFVIGDIINVEGVVGEVLSIDILSIKLRTFDNEFVRMPNENILKSKVITLTRFPIRRASISVGVAYKEDIPRVKEILMEVAEKNPLCLQEPAPLIIFEGFGDSAILLGFKVWAAREDLLTMRTEVYEAIKQRFDEEGIEIPFPHVSIYAGSATDPMPLWMKDKYGKNVREGTPD